MLVQAGVNSPSDLRALGSVHAFLQVREAGLRPSLNLLWALEGAIQDLPWQQVARTDRLRLLMELEDVVRPVRPPGI